MKSVTSNVESTSCACYECGPSGFSMLHHLWMRGCAVTGMDGAHLSPWPFSDPMQPIADYSDICEDLSTQRWGLVVLRIRNYGQMG